MPYIPPEIVAKAKEMDLLTYLKNYEPQVGDIIFFDWDGDGTSDHVGIVEKCENGVVYTVEGNSGDACRGRKYSVGSASILGYGAPDY